MNFSSTVCGAAPAVLHQLTVTNLCTGLFCSNSLKCACGSSVESFEELDRYATDHPWIWICVSPVAVVSDHIY
jgi:hypothetical protein